MLKNTIRWGLAFAVLMVFIPQGFAHAYLDPGSGSFIIQILVAGLLGLLVTFRVWKDRLLNIFHQSGSDSTDDAPQATPDDES